MYSFIHSKLYTLINSRNIAQLLKLSVEILYFFFFQNKTTEENERRLSSEMQKIREEMGE